MMSSYNAEPSGGWGTQEMKNAMLQSNDTPDGNGNGQNSTRTTHDTHDFKCALCLQVCNDSTTLIFHLVSARKSALTTF